MKIFTQLHVFSDIKAYNTLILVMYYYILAGATKFVLILILWDMIHFSSSCENNK